MNRFLVIFAGSATLLVIMLGLALLFANPGNAGSPKILILSVFIVIFSLLLVFGLFVVQLLRNHPATVGISLLGLPGSGKTTYANILFDTLQVRPPSSWAFYPFDGITIERVTSVKKGLLDGKFPAKTIDSSEENVHTYRAHVTIPKYIIKQKYRIEILDYAGENTEVLAARGA